MINNTNASFEGSFFFLNVQRIIHLDELISLFENHKLTAQKLYEEKQN